jgi:hypothetical protein
MELMASYTTQWRVRHLWLCGSYRSYLLAVSKDTACPKLLAEALTHFLHLIIVHGISKKITTVAQK